MNFKEEELFNSLKVISQESNTVALVFSDNASLCIASGACEVSVAIKDIKNDANGYSRFLKYISDILHNSKIHKICFGIEDILRLAPENAYRSSFCDDLLIMAYAISTEYRNISEFSRFCKIFAIESESIYKNALQLYDKLTPMLLKNSFYSKYDLPLAIYLRKIEHTGMLVDLKELNSLYEEFIQKMKIYEEKIYEISNDSTLNIGSPKQIQQLLFAKMQLHKKIEEGTNGVVKINIQSTNADILETIAEFGFKIAEYILEWRKLAKLVNTYITGLKDAMQNYDDAALVGMRESTEIKKIQVSKAIDEQNVEKHTEDVKYSEQRIHCHLHATSTLTRRLSASKPNLQSIPTASDEGNKIRRAFIAPQHKKLIIADYSQIEIRLLAHIGKVRKLIELLNAGSDIHLMTASEIFRVSISNVTSSMRRMAKAVNFGIIYGISPFGLSKHLKVGVAEAKQYIDSYFAIYPEISQYIKNITTFALQNSYVETIYENRCYVDAITSKNPIIRNMAKRSAVNAPLQGSAADILRVAIVELPTKLREKITMQIHDELIFEVYEDEVSDATTQIREIMENVIKLDVPLLVNIRAADSWQAEMADH